MSWTLGVLVGLPVTILFVLIGAALIVVPIIVYRRALRKHVAAKARDEYSHFPDKDISLIVAGAFVLLLTLIIAGCSYFPYNAKFHQWKPISGTISAIDSRIADNGGDASDEEYGVILQNGVTYIVADTRLANTVPGAGIKLSCKPEWQYTGTDSIRCQLVSVTRS